MDLNEVESSGLSDCKLCGSKPKYIDSNFYGCEYVCSNKNCKRHKFSGGFESIDTAMDGWERKNKKEEKIITNLEFGDYNIEVINNHAIISKKDISVCNPTFYELQHMKCMAFGGSATAIEIFPSYRNLVDGANQRHLWLVEEDTVPNLFTGNMVEI